MIQATNYDMNIAVDFVSEIITGSTTINFTAITPANLIVLDYAGLKIKAVTNVTDSKTPVAVQYDDKYTNRTLGNALQIEIAGGKSL